MKAMKEKALRYCRRWGEVEFIEGRVLPVVCAFAAGVALMSQAGQTRLMAEQEAAAQARAQLSQIRVACGVEPDMTLVALAARIGIEQVMEAEQ